MIANSVLAGSIFGLSFVLGMACAAFLQPSISEAIIVEAKPNHYDVQVQEGRAIIYYGLPSTIDFSGIPDNAKCIIWYDEQNQPFNLDCDLPNGETRSYLLKDNQVVID
jgi:hypothetical protein